MLTEGQGKGQNPELTLLSLAPDVQARILVKASAYGIDRKMVMDGENETRVNKV